MKSFDYEYGTSEYFHARVSELEKERDTATKKVSDYIKTNF